MKENVEHPFFHSISTTLVTWTWPFITLAMYESFTSSILWCYVASQNHNCHISKEVTQFSFAFARFKTIGIRWGCGPSLRSKYSAPLIEDPPQTEGCECSLQIADLWRTSPKMCFPLISVIRWRKQNLFQKQALRNKRLTVWSQSSEALTPLYFLWARQCIVFLCW